METGILKSFKNLDMYLAPDFRHTLYVYMSLCGERRGRETQIKRVREIEYACACLRRSDLYVPLDPIRIDDSRPRIGLAFMGQPYNSDTLVPHLVS